MQSSPNFPLGRARKHVHEGPVTAARVNPFGLRTRCRASQMTNLLLVLPNFDPKPYTHVLPSLEKALISTNDLLTLDALDVAKRAQLPPSEVKKLASAVLDGLHGALGLNGGLDEPSDTQQNDATSAWQPPTNGASLAGPSSRVSTLDAGLDDALGGGIPAGYVTEITGER